MQRAEYWFKPSLSWAWLWGAAVLLHLLLLPFFPLLWQTVAVLLLTGVLPGYLVVQLILGRTAPQPTPSEQWLYTIGAGYSFMVVAMLGLSYLPGAITRGQALLWFDGWLLLLLLSFTSQQRRVTLAARPPEPPVHARNNLHGAFSISPAIPAT